jgi:hypothetical protein
MGQAEKKNEMEIATQEHKTLIVGHGAVEARLADELSALPAPSAYLP